MRRVFKNKDGRELVLSYNSSKHRAQAERVWPILKEYFLKRELAKHFPRIIFQIKDGRWNLWMNEAYFRKYGAYIFIEENSQIREGLIEHELTHIRQFEETLNKKLRSLSESVNFTYLQNYEKYRKQNLGEWYYLRMILIKFMEKLQKEGVAWFAHIDLENPYVYNIKIARHQVKAWKKDRHEIFRLMNSALKDISKEGRISNAEYFFLSLHNLLSNLGQHMTYVILLSKQVTISQLYELNRAKFCSLYENACKILDLKPVFSYHDKDALICYDLIVRRLYGEYLKLKH